MPVVDSLELSSTRDSYLSGSESLEISSLYLELPFFTLFLTPTVTSPYNRRENVRRVTLSH